MMPSEEARAFAETRDDTFVFSPVRGRNRAKSFELVPGGRACTSMGMKLPEPTRPTVASEAALLAWLTQAEPGEMLEYYRGFLGIDRTEAGRVLGFKDRRDLVTTAKRALRLAEQDLVHLVQRRNGPGNFSYFVIARPRPADRSVALTAFLLEEAA